jgi:hypothetical protein
MTVRRVAIALTVWFTLLNALVLFQVPVMDRFFVVAIPALYSYFLLPVRWGAVLTWQLRSVRAKPLRWLPHAAAVQIAAVALAQAFLGLMSLAGWWTLWNDPSKTGDRIAGFVFHAGVPAVMVYLLARRTPATPNPATNG